MCANHIGKQFSLLVAGVGMPGWSLDSLGSLIPSWCSLKEYASFYPTSGGPLII